MLLSAKIVPLIEFEEQNMYPKTFNYTAAELLPHEELSEKVSNILIIKLSYLVHNALDKNNKMD